MGIFIAVFINFQDIVSGGNITRIRFQIIDLPLKFIGVVPKVISFKDCDEVAFQSSETFDKVALSNFIANILFIDSQIDLIWKPAFEVSQDVGGPSVEQSSRISISTLKLVICSSILSTAFATKRA